MTAVHALVLPSEPDSTGVALHAPGMGAPTTRRCRIVAANDMEAVAEWIRSKRNLSAATREHCTVVGKKFLWWMHRRGDLTLARISFEHVDEFIEFCSRLPEDLEEGAPFRRSLSAASAQQMRVVVSGLLNWLVKARYIEDNPLDLSAKPRNQRDAQQAKMVTRRFSDAEWSWIGKTIEAMPGETPRERVHRARARYLFELLQNTGLRLSEVCNNTMSGFTYLRSGDMQGWFLIVTGKGGKTRDIPVPVAVMEHVRAYRTACGLPERIPPGDSTGLILSVAGNRPIKRRVVARIIEEVLRSALGNATAAGVPEAELAGLKEGSTHWLRHTYGSKLGEANTPLPVIRDNLGHASITTSSIYVHSDRLRRHAETLKALQGREGEGG